MKTGAKDRAAKQSQYDFVFDDAIGFVQDQMLAGGRLLAAVPLQCCARSCCCQRSDCHSLTVHLTCNAIAALAHMSSAKDTC